MIVLSLLSALVDYLFRSAVAAERDVAGMNAIFGAYNADAGFIALAFQLVLTRALLNRLGLFPFLMLIPLGVAISAMAAIFEGMDSLGNFLLTLLCLGSEPSLGQRTRNLNQ